MKTVQMTLDEDLLKAVDRVAKQAGTSRSSFTRLALKAAVRDFYEKKMEEKHRLGYLKQPVEPGEFDLWELEQAWGDE